ncbi:MAG: PorT family protein [Gemmatimonadota bacterium]|nr:MAG: PorT family protein [Gemmatimonadota bacterium]
MRALRITAALLILAAVAATPAAAQEMMALGLKGGFNRATVSATIDGTAQNTGTRNGGHIGVSANVALSPMWQLQMDVLYVGKGFNASDEVDARLSVNYVEFPVLLVAMLPPAGPRLLSARVFAGPSFSWRVTCSIQEATSDASNFQDCDRDAAKVLDIGVMVGGGLKIGRGYGGLTFDVAYDYGFTNISTGAGGNVKNRNLLFTAGILVPFK